MTEALAELLGATQAALAVGFLVFLRVGAVMAVLPAFSEHSVPQRVRLVLALALTIVVGPAVAPQVAEIVVETRALIPAMLAEAVVGLALGLTMRLFVIVLQTAGSIAAQSTSLSQILGTAAAEPLPAMGHIMVISGLALAVMSGLHVRVVAALIQSYSLFEPGKFPDPALIADWGVQRVGAAFGLAFTLAAPFVIASFIYNVALGVINKAMPQLMVAFVGAPAITAGGLILLFLTLPLLLPIWGASFFGFLADLTGP